MAGLHFKVDAVLNNHREVIGLFAGDLVAEHRAAAKLAWEVYYTKTVKDDLGDQEKIIHCRDWAETLEILKENNGPGTKVGVCPYVFLQLPDTSAK